MIDSQSIEVCIEITLQIKILYGSNSVADD